MGALQKQQGPGYATSVANTKLCW